MLRKKQTETGHVTKTTKKYIGIRVVAGQPAMMTMMKSIFFHVIFFFPI